LKNINIKKLSIDWKSKEKAWMTSLMMEECLRAFNAKMKQQKRNVPLLLDKGTCYPWIELSDVQLASFFPNTTSVSQPMDQGVIKCVKLKYCMLLMQSPLVNIEDSATQLTC
jgi:hypothetical protein